MNTQVDTWWHPMSRRSGSDPETVTNSNAKKKRVDGNKERGYGRRVIRRGGEREGGARER